MLVSFASVQRGGHYHTIWKLATSGKATRREIETIDIRKLCSDVLNERDLCKAHGSDVTASQLRPNSQLFTLQSDLILGLTLCNLKFVGFMLADAKEEVNRLLKPLADAIQPKQTPKEKKRHSRSLAAVAVGAEHTTEEVNTIQATEERREIMLDMLTLPEVPLIRKENMVKMAKMRDITLQDSPPREVHYIDWDLDGFGEDEFVRDNQMQGNDFIDLQMQGFAGDVLHIDPFEQADQLPFAVEEARDVQGSLRGEERIPAISPREEEKREEGDRKRPWQTTHNNEESEEEIELVGRDEKGLRPTPRRKSRRVSRTFDIVTTIPTDEMRHNQNNYSDIYETDVWAQNDVFERRHANMLAARANRELEQLLSRPNTYLQGIVQPFHDIFAHIRDIYNSNMLNGLANAEVRGGNVQLQPENVPWIIEEEVQRMEVDVDMQTRAEIVEREEGNRYARAELRDEGKEEGSWRQPGQVQEQIVTGTGIEMPPLDDYMPFAGTVIPLRESLDIEQFGIISLSLSNFKSYKEEVQIGDLRSFNAIIGQNGSGKSNFLNAIQFVLNERVKKLGVRRSEELIHGSNMGRPTADSAAVEMLFKPSNGSSDYVTFRKEVNAKGQCQWEVDGKDVTSSEYNELLKSAGLDVNAKNCIIRQDQMSKIAKTDGKGRTALFIKLSGVSTMKKRDEELQTAIREAEKEAKRLEGKSQLARQVVEAKRNALRNTEEYEREKSITEKLLEQLTLFELYVIDNEVRAAKDKRAKLTEKRAEITKEQENSERTMKELEMKISRFEEKTKKLQIELLNKEQNLNDECFLKTRAELKARETEIANLETEQQKTEEERCKAEAELNVLRAQLDEVTHEIEEHEIATQQGLQLTQMAMEEYRRLDEQAWIETAQSRRDIEYIEDEKRRKEMNLLPINNKLMKLDIGKTVLESEIAALQKKIADCYERLEAMEAEVAGGELHELRQKKQNMRREYDEKTNRLQALDKELSDSLLRQDNKFKNRQKEQALQGLKALYSDKIIGRVHNYVIPVKPKFNLAVARAFKFAWNGILCDTVQTAEEAVRYLKRNGHETEVFYPMSALSSPPINLLRGLSSQADTSTEQMSPIFDKLRLEAEWSNELKNALQHICGKTMYVEDEQEAWNMANGKLLDGMKLTSISKEGTLYKTDGTIQGGKAGLSGRVKQLDHRQQQLSQNEQPANLEEKRQEKFNLETAIRNLLNEMRSHGIVLAEAEDRARKEKMRAEGLLRIKEDIEGHLADRCKQLEVVNEEIAQIRQNEIAQLRDEIEQLQNDINKKAQEITITEQEIFANFCRRHGFNSIQEYGLRAHEAQLGALDNQLPMRRMQLQAQYKAQEENLDELQERIHTLRNTMTEVNNVVKELKEQTREDEKKQEVIKKDMEKLKEAVGKEKREEGDGKAELVAGKKKLQKLKRDGQAAQREQLSAEGEEKKQREHRFRLLQQAKLNGLQLPLIAGSWDSIDNDENFLSTPTSGTPVNQSLLEETIRKAMELCIDYDRMNDEYIQIDLSKKSEVNEKMTQMRGELEKCRTNMDRLAAEATVDAAKREWEEARLEKAEAEKTHKEAQIRVAEAMKESNAHREAMSHCFDDYLNVVNDRLRHIYKSLTNSSAADIEVYSSVDFHSGSISNGLVGLAVVPPGKRLTPVERLSGAEKTVVSLTLLLAMHAVNLPPFIVLDEVDAFMDNTNIAKLASFIYRECGRMQFVVITHQPNLYEKAAFLMRVRNVAKEGPTVSEVSFKSNPQFEYYLAEELERQHDIAQFNDDLQMDEPATEPMRYMQYEDVKDEPPIKRSTMTPRRHVNRARRRLISPSPLHTHSSSSRTTRNAASDRLRIQLSDKPFEI